MDDIKDNPAAEIKSVKRKSGFKKFLRWFIFLVFIFYSAYVYWTYFNVYSDGERTGFFIKLSRKGNIFKTYEGEMNIGSSTQISTTGAQSFVFSVANAQLADSLMKIQGKNLSLQYKEYRGTLPWRGDSRYIVTGISKINN